MTKFKAGDKVVRVADTQHCTDGGFMKQGEVYEISLVKYHGDSVEVVGSNYTYAAEYFKLTEPQSKNMKGMFSNMKFRVNSPEHSKEIQEALFTLGYKWVCETHFVVEQTDKPFLFADADGRISYGFEYYTFQDLTDYQECVVEVVKSYKIIPVEIKKETITIDGKTYDKEAVLKCLVELEDVV